MGTLLKSSNATFDRTIFHHEILFGEWQLDKTIYFMQRTNLPIAILVTILYIAMVYYGQKWMANRKPLNLRPVLVVWNFTLSIYSFITVYKILPFLVQILMKDGLLGSVCHNNGQYSDPVSGYWTWLFAMSKGPELLDTLFLILRKRPVIFMHWYHHSVTYLGGQIFFCHLVPGVRWGIVWNATVHTIMYFYYGLMVLKVGTPKYFAKLLTLLQIVQFSFGLVLAYPIASLYLEDELSKCAEGRLELIPLATFVSGSYLLLFCDYFVRAHILGQSPTKQRMESKETGGEKKDEMVKKEQ